MGKYFGTDGFRGVAGSELTAEHAFELGRYLGIYYGKAHRCRAVIGKDTRRSCYMLEYALTAGLTSVGADAYLMHVTTTPSVSYAVCTGGFDCGIMISASHNPYYDNGIKLIDGSGGKTGDGVIAGAELYLDGVRDDPPPAVHGDIGIAVDHSSGRGEYIKHLISLGGSGAGGLRIGLDTANGSASGMAGGIFEAIGAQTFSVGNSPDGFNINRGCGSTAPQALAGLVREKQLDIGFAFDGDADRCIAVDENGGIITGDHILYILGCRMKERGALAENTVISTVMSNSGLGRAFAEKGISLRLTDVGDRNVSEEMRRGSFCLGGESSGHIIISQYGTTGDGLVTAVLLARLLAQSGTRASELSRGLFMYPQLTKNVRARDRDAALSDPAVIRAAAQAEQALGGRGKLLVRKSGTEPVIRITVEAESRELCSELADGIASAIAGTEYA